MIYKLTNPDKKKIQKQFAKVTKALEKSGTKHYEEAIKKLIAWWLKKPLLISNSWRQGEEHAEVRQFLLGLFSNIVTESNINISDELIKKVTRKKCCITFFWEEYKRHIASEKIEFPEITYEECKQVLSAQDTKRDLNEFLRGNPELNVAAVVSLLPVNTNTNTNELLPDLCQGDNSFGQDNGQELRNEIYAVLTQKNFNAGKAELSKCDASRIKEKCSSIIGKVDKNKIKNLINTLSSENLLTTSNHREVFNILLSYFLDTWKENKNSLNVIRDIKLLWKGYRQHLNDNQIKLSPLSKEEISKVISKLGAKNSVKLFKSCPSMVLKREIINKKTIRWSVAVGNDEKSNAKNTLPSDLTLETKEKLRAIIDKHIKKKKNILKAMVGIVKHLKIERFSEEKHLAIRNYLVECFCDKGLLTSGCVTYVAVFWNVYGLYCEVNKIVPPQITLDEGTKIVNALTEEQLKFFVIAAKGVIEAVIECKVKKAKDGGEVKVGKRAIDRNFLDNLDAKLDEENKVKWKKIIGNQSNVKVPRADELKKSKEKFNNQLKEKLEELKKLKELAQIVKNLEYEIEQMQGNKQAGKVNDKQLILQDKQLILQDMQTKLSALKNLLNKKSKSINACLCCKQNRDESTPGKNTPTNEKNTGKKNTNKLLSFIGVIGNFIKNIFSGNKQLLANKPNSIFENLFEKGMELHLSVGENSKNLPNDDADSKGSIDVQIHGKLKALKATWDGLHFSNQSQKNDGEFYIEHLDVQDRDSKGSKELSKMIDMQFGKKKQLTGAPNPQSSKSQMKNQITTKGPETNNFFSNIFKKPGNKKVNYKSDDKKPKKPFVTTLKNSG